MHPLAGVKQTEEHISKRTESIKKTRSSWTEETKKKWKENISKSKQGSTPWNKGLKGAQKPWNKGNNWRDKYTDEEIRAINAERARKRRANNPQLRLDDRFSCLIRLSLRDGKQGRKWEELVGYTLSDLEKHLESLFQDGMSWENMGKWHIDHIVPRSSFSYKTPNDPDFKVCWSLDNIQPLWAIDNLKKGKGK